MAIKLTDKELKKGVWDFIKKNKYNIFDLTTNYMCNKRKGYFYQLLDLLRGNNFFCYEYSLSEGCTNCNYNFLKVKNI